MTRTDRLTRAEFLERMAELDAYTEHMARVAATRQRAYEAWKDDLPRRHAEGERVHIDPDGDPILCIEPRHA